MALATSVVTATTPPTSLNAANGRKLDKLAGTELGEIVLEDGNRLKAGRVMMRGESWNTALHGPFGRRVRGGGKKAPGPDVWIHKEWQLCSLEGEVCLWRICEEGILGLPNQP